MVTTRGQEQQQVTPPPAALAPGGPQASPATPRTLTLPNGRQLKSALKTSRFAGPSYSDDDEGGGDGDGGQTPPGAGIKKRVRINSGNNMTKVFSVSGATGTATEPLEEGDEEGDGGTPDSQRGRRSRSRTASPGGGGGDDHSPVFAALSILAWMVTSSGLIFANKVFMVDLGFRYPMALTAITQLGSAALAWAVRWVGLVPVRRPPGLAVTVTQLAPIAFCSAAALFLGNFAYLGLSVAFINILKALTPAATLATALALGRERPSLLALGSTLLIGLGTGIATTAEVSSSHFSWLAFASFSVSIGFESLRVVLVEATAGDLRYNAVEVLAYIGPLTFGFLAAGAAVWERDGLLAGGGFDVLRRHPVELAVAVGMSFMVNLSTFFAIQASSSTTFKVAGCLKNSLVVWAGASLGDRVTSTQVEGYALSLLGFLLYTGVKWAVAGGKSATSAGRRAKAA